MSERYLSKIVMDLLLERKNDKTGRNEILLLERMGTGYYDGYYDLPGGHLEEGEDIFDGMIREAKEEIGITILREDMEIKHIYHAFQKNALKFVFNAKKYIGPIINNEPQSCKSLEWFEIDNLPENIIPSIKIELENIRNQKYYDASKKQNLAKH